MAHRLLLHFLILSIMLIAISNSTFQPTVAATNLYHNDLTALYRKSGDNPFVINYFLGTRGLPMNFENYDVLFLEPVKNNWAQIVAYLISLDEIYESLSDELRSKLVLESVRYRAVDVFEVFSDAGFRWTLAARVTHNSVGHELWKGAYHWSDADIIRVRHHEAFAEFVPVSINLSELNSLTRGCLLIDIWSTLPDANQIIFDNLLEISKSTATHLWDPVLAKLVRHLLRSLSDPKPFPMAILKNFAWSNPTFLESAITLLKDRRFLCDDMNPFVHKGNISFQLKGVYHIARLCKENLDLPTGSFLFNMHLDTWQLLDIYLGCSIRSKSFACTKNLLGMVWTLIRQSGKSVEKITELKSHHSGSDVVIILKGFKKFQLIKVLESTNENADGIPSDVVSYIAKLMLAVDIDF